MSVNSFDSFQSSQGVFIVGSGRCGTTLLRLMMDNHPGIAIADESGFISTFRVYQNLSLAKAKQRYQIIMDIIDFLYQTLSQDKNLFWTSFLKQHLKEIISGSHDFNSMLFSMFRIFHHSSQKQIWGDNTPHYIQIADYLKTVFPQLRFIHLIRDGRDVFLSLKRVPWGPNTVYTSAAYWKSIIEKGEYFQKKWPDDWLPVRYEDLLREPEKTLKQITDFLDIVYDPIMLEFYKSARNKLPQSIFNSHFEKTTSPLDPSNCDKWKRKMAKQERMIFEAVTGKILQRYGYETEFNIEKVKVSLLSGNLFKTRDFLKRVDNLLSDPLGGKSVIKYRWWRYYRYRFMGVPTSGSDIL